MSASPIYIVVQLWIAPRKRAAFEEYERKALARFQEHSGKVMTTFVPEGAGIDGRPDEVHILWAPSRAAFETFRAAPEMAALAGERAEVIARTEILLSETLQAYTQP